MSRSEILTQDVKAVFCELSGQEPSSLPDDVTFLEMGFDSLVLTQVALAATRRFGVVLKLRDFLEDHATISDLVAHLDKTMPTPAIVAAAAPIQQPSVASSTPSSAGILSVNPVQNPIARVAAGSLALPQLPIGSVATGPVSDLINAQLALMARQLDVLAGARSMSARTTNVAVAEPRPQPATVGGPVTLAVGTTPSVPTEIVPATGPAPSAPTRHGPQLVIERARTSQLTPSQERHIARLIERYAARTAKSKSFTQRNRASIADPRVPAGFKPALKELVYPIVVDRSSGCRLWDLDGNEYIDLLNGYGSNFFGFGADFVRQAIRDQLELGMEIGPQSPLIEEVSELFRRLVPGADRIAFCNTGSEAVLATLRLARTVTGRDRVVMFQGGYHGIFDEVVARGLPGGRSLPAAPGIPRSATENLTILDWGSDQALDWLRNNIGDVGAVLVEPVQSRHPEIQPVEFLREIRKLTEQGGATLIFDEVVTGFRIAPGGAQEHFGIRADLASYGKVIGGGLSIGVVAGKREFMDALDGGAWSFGDDSMPEVGVTYFAGTFVRHPIHLAAARAVLRHLVAEGPSLQQHVNEQSGVLARELNALFIAEGAPLELQNFGSVLRVASTATVTLGEILFAHLRERGVHAWDGRPCFLTVAHERPELDFIVQAFRGAIEDMQEGDFYPRRAHVESATEPPIPGARLGRDQSGKPAWFIPDPASAGRYVQVGAAQ